MPDTPSSSDIPPAWRRIVAFAMDYLVIAAYFGVMSAISFVLRSLGLGLGSSYITVEDKLQGQATAVLLFTLPVICYFALLEASAWQATIGKRLMRLVVVGRDGRRIARRTSFLRSAIKFVPWEIAHAGIWYVSGQPFLSPPSAFSRCAWIVSTGLVFWWIVSLFIGNRRAPYDWIAKTRVLCRRG